MHQWLLFVTGFFLFALSSCGTTKEYFHVDQSSYEPAILNESSQITSIEMIVSQVDTSIEFTSMIFRNLEIPVETEWISEDKVRLTSYIQVGGKLVEGHYQKIREEESDKLYFTVGKSRKYVLLSDIERKTTQFPDR